MEHVHLQRYSRHVYYDADEQEYVALCNEFPHLSAFGETIDEALAELDVALDGALAVHQEEGWPIPDPLAPPEPQGLPSGRFVVRLPRTLHARLVRRAGQEGVSLNALIIALLAEGHAGRSGDDRLALLTAAVHDFAMLPKEPGSQPAPRTVTSMDLVRDLEDAWRDEERQDMEEAWGEVPYATWERRGATEPAQEVWVN